ncbi:argininosuccinate synthase [Methylacidimicrobium tartarophylax]|uniref:Argininosuccinate synthase n=1 Tax=Methylacidimicrobium tartarophylax TaxID=1041768 RepID=A0A5E6MCF4_9BACT|nr:argininosuccinate synthase [Methylacidimicrobium tartarophylax]VVM06610.1 argininosuccinate synthase [Methylacidimicrobium tartarophylax]
MKIVLAYSGGLDTSVILKWLTEKYKADVIAYCADVGQAEELTGLEEKARQTGASRCLVSDLREEFVRDYVFPMIRAGALYEDQYLLGTSIARPLIAKRQVEIAREVGADAVAHGATGKGNDQVRFELAFAALAPDLRVIAPWREWDLAGRADLIRYAEEHGIPVPVTTAKPYSMDRNLFHISYESGVLEDPWQPPPPDLFRLTRNPEDAPDEPETLELSFESGNCVAVNGKSFSPAALLSLLNEIGGRHGIGRVDLVENRFVGMKSRGVYECPGGTILRFAHRQIETLTLDREVMHLRDSLLPRYAELVYYGFWFSPEREFLQAAIEQSQQVVTGTVRLRLFKGALQTMGRKSPQSLYDLHLATMEADQGAYDPRDATGFIHLNALRLRTAARRQQQQA